jgi:hypothetical protein
MPLANHVLANHEIMFGLEFASSHRRDLALFLWRGIAVWLCPVRSIDDRFSEVGSLGRLGWAINSACGHQEQEQRALPLIFRL